jgi:hypothetical protein
MLHVLMGLVEIRVSTKRWPGHPRLKKKKKKKKKKGHIMVVKEQIIYVVYLKLPENNTTCKIYFLV